MAEPPGPLGRLARLNRTTVFLVTVGVLLLALFLPGWYGAVLLLALVTGLAAVLRLTWRVQAPATRLLRLLILGVVVVVAIYKVT